MILLIKEFLIIGLLTFGGGSAMIPLLLEIAQKNNWISREVFTDFLAISQITPGPIAINMATFVGFNALGVLGGIIASIAVIIPGVILTFGVRRLNSQSKLYRSVIEMLKVAVVSLLAYAIYLILGTTNLTTSPIAFLLLILAIFINGIKKIPLPIQIIFFSILGVVCF